MTKKDWREKITLKKIESCQDMVDLIYKTDYSVYGLAQTNWQIYDVLHKVVENISTEQDLALREIAWHLGLGEIEK